MGAAQSKKKVLLRKKFTTKRNEWRGGLKSGRREGNFWRRIRGNCGRNGRKEVNWDEKSDSEFECMVCLEFKRKLCVSNCCNSIICRKCVSKLKGSCPLRCKKLSEQFGTRKALDERVTKILISCDICLTKIHPWNMTAHKNNCGERILTERISDCCLHDCVLISKYSTNEWKCHARENIIQDHKDNKENQYYECEKCQIKICKFCVARAKLQGENCTLNSNPLNSPISVFFHCKISENIIPDQDYTQKPSYTPPTFPRTIYSL
ncbi:unnamed protein product [Moneuplotes crassus]|uniref:RING-type domain-containing protein n=1 Tax=Euplotes crassus TaxID=5936 RepID=A0AAD1XP78_EUPCR|nr:unnamed protein product [Moneuplotes crassus]